MPGDNPGVPAPKSIDAENARLAAVGVKESIANHWVKVMRKRRPEFEWSYRIKPGGHIEYKAAKK